MKMLLQFLWELLSSRTAIGLYVLIVLALILWLVIAVLRADSSRVHTLKGCIGFGRKDLKREGELISRKQFC